MSYINRTAVLTLVAALSVTALSVHYWRKAGLMKVEDYQVHCRQQFCEYQLTLVNPGEHQGARLLWEAHIVDKEVGKVFGYLQKNTRTIVGKEEYLVSGSRRTVTGNFRKPSGTNYVVLKLEPIRD